MRCRYSTIDPKDLMENIIPRYAIEEPVECVFWERGANDTYLVRCANARYFLRVFRSGAFSREANEFEAEALCYLHQQGNSVAYPIALKSGNFISEIAAPEGPRYILLTAIAEGDIPDYRVVDNSTLVGESLARMHQASNGFETSRQRNRLDLQWLLEDSIAVIKDHVESHTKALSLIDAIAPSVRNAVLEVPSDSLDFGLCHGDFHGGNLHVYDKNVTLFDFEECAFGYRVYDIATFKWDLGFGERRVKLWSAFLQGYELIRPLSESESSLVDTFVILRELAETAYGIRHIDYFGHNGIKVADIDDWCEQLVEFVKYTKLDFT